MAKLRDLLSPEQATQLQTAVVKTTKKLDEHPGWTSAWPKQRGWFWFYGYRTRLCEEPDLRAVRVYATTVAGVFAYSCGGSPLYVHEGTCGLWQTMIVPDSLPSIETLEKLRRDEKKSQGSSQ